MQRCQILDMPIRVDESEIGDKWLSILLGSTFQRKIESQRTHRTWPVLLKRVGRVEEEDRGEVITVGSRELYACQLPFEPRTLS